jgi:hypothetical protein
LGGNVALFNLINVKNFISESNIDCVTDIQLRVSDNVVLLYLNKSLLLQKSKIGLISKKKINSIKNKVIEKFKCNVEVILSLTEEQKELEAGLYRLLNRKFHNSIISLYLSFINTDSVEAIIEGQAINDALRNEVVEFFRNQLKDVDINLLSVRWFDSHEDFPSPPELLRYIKKHQPITMTDLLVVLHELYESVSEKWLGRQLDALRKKGFLLREPSKHYVLTAHALSEIPAGKRRSSSDIERALALGRRKW